METPKISVITPVYNAEKYLQRCVDSILTQSYRDFELLLIDDGSKDNSGAMCDSIALQDCRVRVVHQQNAGAGPARNVGIKRVKGEYVVFVDSDDVIRQGYFEALSKHSEDVVYINVDNIDDQGKIVKREYMSNYISVDDILRSQMTGKLPWGGVRKCVKLSLIRGSNISYSNHKIGEEAIYSYQVLRHAKSVGFINEPVYCYMLHDDSLSNTKTDDPWGNVALALREEIMKQGDYSQYADTLNAFIKTAGAVAMMRTAQNHPFKLFREKGRVTLSKYLEVADKSYSTDWKHASEKARLMYCLMELRLWPVIWIVSRLRG